MLDRIRNYYWKNYRLYICLFITVSIISVSVFCFGSSYSRFLTAVVDLGTSVAFFFGSLFGIDGINPTVNNFDFDINALLPVDWEDFKIMMQDFGHSLIDFDNFLDYIDAVNGVIYILVFALLIILPIFFILYFILGHYINNKENNDYNLDSKALCYWKDFSKRVCVPVRGFISGLKEFVVEHSNFLKLWLIIVLLSFNIFSVIIDFFAYYFYFAVTFKAGTIYIQVYKLFVDLSVLSKVPLSIWIIAIALFLMWWRKKIGYSRLQHNEAKNCGFISEMPICILMDAVMGAGKTKTVTDMTLSLSVIFRSKALELLTELDLMFPHFPWIEFECFLMREMNMSRIYNLASCEKRIRTIEKYFGFYWNKENGIYSLNHKYDIYFVDVESAVSKAGRNCFSYDINKYGYTYDNGHTVEYLFDALSDYAKLYFIYVVESSLVYSNYAIRFDDFKLDKGNFPLYFTDFFHTASADVKDKNVYSHVVDYDMLRLGKKMLANNENSNVFEFGIFALMEIDKERGNMLDTNELKKLDTECNQKNDLFNGTIKMSRHPAVIRNYSFVRFLMDSQRLQSLNADLRELCETVDIESNSEIKLLMPFFSLEELLHQTVYPWFENLYHNYRFNRGDNTLSMYFLKNVVSYFESWYKRYYNTFGCITEKVYVSKSANAEKVQKHDYYIQPKKIYSARYSTDALSGYFKDRAAKSNIGIADIRTYQSVIASMDELKAQNSHFVRDITKNMDI